MSLTGLLQQNLSSGVPYHLIRFLPGKTPLSTWPPVVFAIAGYLLLIFGIQEYMQTRKPFEIRGLSQIHNSMLSAGSLILLALTLEEVVPMVSKHGFHYGICSPEAWTPTLETYYLVNYYIKYVELLDTVFLVLKKKPLTFLHVFHHAATAVLAFTTFLGKPSMSWFIMLLNLTVHVFMYYYYYAAAARKKIWWKKYITTMQITQFVIDGLAISYAAFHHFLATYAPFIPNNGHCTTSKPVAALGMFLLAFYLYLFLGFYGTTYIQPNSKGQKLSIIQICRTFVGI
ncbi:hypothetical protein M422DRAFT_165435 [Sphaerobolus stellatus SS14]|uniref:Elongation of fatty acids protein n=1 Tax=Sphaerobolus stellatus (strain SS14) TaxID=990650 RepID=A0A0C9UTY2_SPHS4|nr:hypothetical protein M422DRAFT_165435 [Sphaerobolus stellatus SS14]